ncbi:MULTISPECIES: SxtJ family membrane protein [Okeania]|uniref:SxtJ n=2 Tax=Okeania TaxID=1458928 RepID=A0A3N6P2N8_9CYAN|nr:MULTISPECIES: SxtJ family membrane protein [Okeania]NEP05424.1 sxtJ [Okeania sp. SIO4D6]NET13980.1 sxtJ [Okeania sp. SIO1H6]NEP73138.1 sxtJ [Okeania sp. SIO2G5]NEP91408.1 sxtJ [Okeania sp. SIO2C2]NEP94001.1 sxtJ [Okeania sp. SIO2F5]
MSDREIPKIDKKGLREFGLIVGGVFGGLFGLLLPLLHRHWPPPAWPWIIATPLLVLAIVSPPTLGPVYKFWMRVGIFLSKIMTPLWMGLVFYLVVMPMGLIMRMFKKDPMERQLNTETSTYRVMSQLKTRESMERPF